MIQVEAINQADEPGDFQAWNIAPGPFGGRLGFHTSNAQPPTAPASQRPNLPLADKHANLTWSELPPFSASPPAQLTAEINMLLENANRQHALDQNGTPQGWNDSEHSPAQSAPLPKDSNTVFHQMHINPDSKWFRTPISRRSRIGRRLIASALRSFCTEASAREDIFQEQTDLWETPLMI